MGMKMFNFVALEQLGVLRTGGNVLDIGSSNLLLAKADEIADFVKRHNPKPHDDLEAWAERLSAGGQLGSNGYGLNQTFAGEVLEAAGMGYDAIDIAAGYKTTIVDLNKMRLPERMIGAYDAVLNFGTSEHILNQMNVFAAVHAATKPGGMMVHNVPSVGWVDHGYFVYTSRFFFDLAGYNEYEVVDFWYDGPTFYEGVFDTARQYTSYFPALTKRLEMIGKEVRETSQDAMKIPAFDLTIVYRKQKDVAFRGTMETSTSVGPIPADVTEAYRS
jgi:hypothetical protein